GELDFQFIDSTQGTPLLQSGKLRGLAITSGRRVPGVELPTMAEAANIPEFDIAPAWAVFLPANAPAPTFPRLQPWCEAIVANDATRQFLSRTHAASFPGGAAALAAFVPREIEKWRGLAKIANFQPQ